MSANVSYTGHSVCFCASVPALTAAASRFGLQDPALFAVLAKEALRSLPEFSEQALALIAFSFAKVPWGATSSQGLCLRMPRTREYSRSRTE